MTSDIGFYMAVLHSAGSRNVTRKQKKYQPLDSLPMIRPELWFCLWKFSGPFVFRIFREHKGTDGKEPAGDAFPSPEQCDPS